MRTRKKSNDSFQYKLFTYGKYIFFKIEDILMKGNIKKLSDIKLKKVIEKDMDFLYQLLEGRKINENISHRKMPSLIEHRKFVLSKPYEKWYIIIFEGRKIGSIYLSKINEIGLHLQKDFQKNEIRNKIINKLIAKNPKKRYLVNINPKNKSLIKFFQSKKFKKIQHTYELIKKE